VIACFDEWYFCGEMVKHVANRGFDWISEAKSNRVVFYNEGKLNVSELLDRSRPFFHDTEVDGELYQCLDTEVFIPKMEGKNTRLLINCKADTKDIHFTFTNIPEKEEPSVEIVLRHALKRAGIESFHWDIKNVLGFEDYRFRESDAAIIHSHLVFLAYSLLPILNKRMENKGLPNKQDLHQIDERDHRSISKALRWVKDRCLIAMCGWFKDKVFDGLNVREIVGLINPQMRICK
jgi:hypothetical protein